MRTAPPPGSPDDLARTYARAVHRGMDGLADWAAERLEDAQARERARLEQPGALGTAALWYARHGIPVLPLAPGAKVPLGGRCCWGSHRNGSTQALADPRAVAHWWTAHPDANVGIATGWIFDVIDQDGPASWRSWLDGADWPPVVGVVSTPRPGGVHRYVRTLGARNGQRIAPGIDYRGRGGYVVAPPSVVDGRRYAWLSPLAPPGG